MDLTDQQWTIIEPLFEEKRRPEGRGRPWRDARAVLNGVLWVLRTGAPWHDLPDRYPPYQTCHRRFQQWRKLKMRFMLASMRAGTLSVHLDHRRLDPVVNRLVLGLLTSSLLLRSSRLWSLHAEPVVGGVALFGAIGYAAACLMGVTLLRDIRYFERHQKTGDRGKRPRSPCSTCLSFVTPTESDAAPTTPNLLDINHFAEQPEWN